MTSSSTGSRGVLSSLLPSSTDKTRAMRPFGNLKNSTIFMTKQGEHEDSSKNRRQSFFGSLQERLAHRRMMRQNEEVARTAADNIQQQQQADSSNEDRSRGISKSNSHRGSSAKKNRIVVASCNDQELYNKMWPLIDARKPAAFVWGGDAIYADMELDSADWSSFPPKRHVQCATPRRLQRLYKIQRSIPGYRRLLEQNITIFGALDDHDYGCDNGDRTYKYKTESAVAYVDGFLQQPAASAMSRRARAGHGVYAVKLFDFDRPPNADGTYEVPETVAGIDPDALPDSNHDEMYTPSDKTVAVFVLDVRSHKTPWKQGNEAYEPDFEGDFLGERQWQWLETALRRSKASVNVVVNGLQVHAIRHPDGNIHEAWSKYPVSQQRLYEAILKAGVSAPLLLSGDVHMTQFMRKDCVLRQDLQDTNGKSSFQPHPLVEMTTSGMTHSWGTVESPRLSDIHRVPSYIERYVNWFRGALAMLVHRVSYWNELMYADVPPTSTLLTDASNDNEEFGAADAADQVLYENGGGEGSKRGLQVSLEKNFGELEFDWEARTVTLRSMGEQQQDDVTASPRPPLLMSRFTMDQLSGKSPMPGSGLLPEHFQYAAAAQLQNLLRPHVSSDDWICLNHRGPESPTRHYVGHLVSTFLVVTLVPMHVILPLVLLIAFLQRRLRRSSSRKVPKCTV